MKTNEEYLEDYFEKQNNLSKKLSSGDFVLQNMNSFRRLKKSENMGKKQDKAII